MANICYVRTIGRDKCCHLIVDTEYSSRVYAHSEFHLGKFVLVDKSTNGTYVSMAKKKDIYLRREELLLIGGGEIGLGEPAGKGSIRYICF